MFSKNDINVFTYGYYRGKRFVWENVKQFFRNIKYAWQRATKGYCDQDVWNLDYFLTVLLRDSVEHLADTTHGYPGEYEFEGKDEKDWDAYLRKICLLLDKSIDREFEDDPYYTNQYEEQYKAYLDNPKHFEIKELPDGRCLLLDNDTPEDIELRKNYHTRQKKIWEDKVRDRTRALKMIRDRWDNLWD